MRTRTILPITALAIALLAPLLGYHFRAFGLAETVLLAALLLLGVALLRQELRQYEQRRHAAGLERSLMTLAAGMDDIRRQLSEQGATGEMVREMRLLQTLLSRIVARQPETAREPGTADSRPGQAEDASPATDIRMAVQEALSENRVDLHIQPIVQLPSRRVAHYECFSRVRDARGRVIFPNDYLDIAHSAGLTGTLDNLLLFRCIQLVRKLGHRQPGVRFFVNISPHSIEDDEFFSQFTDFMATNPELAVRLVFEFPLDAFLQLSADARKSLMRLAAAGYVFSLDHAEGLDIDLPLLARTHVRYLKIDGAALLADGEGGAQLARDARGLGISVIATHVEEESQVPDLLDLDFGLSQGYLFGHPRPLKDQGADL